jgi:hypothetical protein
MSKFNFFGNISGQNVSINGEDIIINGKHVNNTDSNGEQIDEVRKVPTKIKKLYVSSNVRVNISEGHEDVIVARLHGIASSKDFQFDIVPNSDSLRVTANIEGASSGGVTIINGTVISNSFNSLQLDIMLPLSSVEIISIQSKSASISVGSIKAPTIDAISTNGSIKLEDAIFKKLQLECKNGSIRVNSYLHSDVEFTIDITSHNGNIDCKLNNLGMSNVDVYSKNGSCHNYPVLSGKYTASGSIISKNGNVKFH